MTGLMNRTKQQEEALSLLRLKYPFTKMQLNDAYLDGVKVTIDILKLKKAFDVIKHMALPSVRFTNGMLRDNEDITKEDKEHGKSILGTPLNPVLHDITRNLIKDGEVSMSKRMPKEGTKQRSVLDLLSTTSEPWSIRDMSMKLNCDTSSCKKAAEFLIKRTPFKVMKKKNEINQEVYYYDVKPSRKKTYTNKHKTTVLDALFVHTDSGVSLKDLMVYSETKVEVVLLIIESLKKDGYKIEKFDNEDKIYFQIVTEVAKQKATPVEEPVMTTPAKVVSTMSNQARIILLLEQADGKLYSAEDIAMELFGKSERKYVQRVHSSIHTLKTKGKKIESVSITDSKKVKYFLGTAKVAKDRAAHAIKPIDNETSQKQPAKVSSNPIRKFDTPSTPKQKDPLMANDIPISAIVPKCFNLIKASLKPLKATDIAEFYGLSDKDAIAVLQQVSEEYKDKVLLEITIREA